MYSISTRSWSISIFVISGLLQVAGPPETCGQVLQTDRFEVPIESRSEVFDVASSSDSGLFLYRQYVGFKEDQIQLVKLDTGLDEKWNGYISVAKNYRLMATESFANKFYLLLRYRDYSRNDLLLYSVEEDTGNYTLFTIKGYIPFVPTEFSVTDHAAIIGGYYNRIPVVLYYSLTEFRSKVLPGLFSESGELTQVQTHEDGSFEVLISAKNLERQRTIWIKSYDPEGNLLRNMALEPGENRDLIFGRSIRIPGDKQIVAGVYGIRSSEFSRGVFVATIAPSGLEQIKYYNFGDLENFFRYMKAKREQRIKSRIQRKKIKGKKLRFNYRFLVHELIPYKDQFVLLGEAFYPHYTDARETSFFGAYSVGPGFLYNGRVFDGFYYTHAVVMGFNENGKLLWDNSFEINDVKSFSLEQFVKVDVLPDRLALMYIYENKIRTKIIQDDRVVEGKSIDPILTFRESDVVRNEKNTKNTLSYWYGDYLYACGMQDIASGSPGVRSNRRVFFINKLHYAR